ncbi:UNVERIFIED_CONTAM: putative RING-type E3 ubiquitin transferase C3H69 [Sesamum calycinum]|uniref:RING-type E3 ubiquitin transferase C3H69 n=1 Tax=Sesamum calycinum TaxID=2727403 RepID=A0AAW2SYA9_9LAMI
MNLILWVLCKFFAHGACLKGEHCEFSHDWKAPPNNICTFYLKGVCAYGSRCRYEHVKVSRQSSAPSSEDISFPVERLSGTATHSTGILADAAAKHSVPSEPPTRPAWETMSGHNNILDRGYGVGYFSNIDSADQSICSFAAAGDCPRGEKCPTFMGTYVQSVGNTVCIPSGLKKEKNTVIWYSSKEEKQDIIDSYKAKLRSIDCKHFDFGNGTCPFGTSCFYKHAYRDGRPEEVVLRHLGAEDGNTVIAKNMSYYCAPWRKPCLAMVAERRACKRWKKTGRSPDCFKDWASPSSNDAVVAVGGVALGFRRRR